MKIIKKISHGLLLSLIAITASIFSCNTNPGGDVDIHGKIKNPSIKIVETIPQGKRYGVCHNWAITQMLGVMPEHFNIPGNDDWYDVIDFLSYCEETSSAQKGDLIIYKYNNESSAVFHTGVVAEEGMVKSKWGTEPCILQHPTLAVPASYETHVQYYQLKQPKSHVIKDITRKASEYISLRKKCFDINKQLLTAAKTSDIDWVKEYLERNICANVNTTNPENKTLLHIAAQNDDRILAQTLLSYNADVDKQDMYGNTALHLAAKNGSGEIMRALYKKNCNKDLKNNAGHDALYYYRDYGSVCP